MTEIQGHHEDDCLMCAVRALTEGRAKEWVPTKVGEQVTGVVLRQGTVPSEWSSTPILFVELWLGGQSRIRVTAFSSFLRSLIDAAELRTGDTVTIRYMGTREIRSKRVAAGATVHTAKIWELDTTRGHR